MIFRALLLVFAGLFLCTAIVDAEILPQDWPEVPFIVRDIEFSNVSYSINVTVELENPYSFDIAKKIPLTLEFEGNSETQYLIVYAQNKTRVINTQSVPVPLRIAFKELNVTYTVKVGSTTKTFTIPMPVQQASKEIDATTPPVTPALPEKRGIPAFEAIFALVGLLAAIYFNRKH